MAAAISTMLPLGTKAPEFTLTDTVTGQKRTLAELQSSKATVIMFICNHCPYVKYILNEIIKTASDYKPRGVSFIAISSNDSEKFPDDSPERMKELAEGMKFPFPYLYDEDQTVALNYQAACTPDFYIFDGEMLCVYRGQFDSARPGNDIPPSGRDIRDALDQILAGTQVFRNQMPSMGCSIKWKG
ncbi:MAG: thioredoxin family protein [Methanococcaceae archaeon]